MDNWSEWLNKTRFESLDSSMINNSIEWLNQVRDLILIKSKVRRTDTVLDIGCGNGLLGLKILSAQKGFGNVIFLDADEDCLSECKRSISELNINTGYKIIHSEVENIQLENEAVDRVVMRSVLAHIDNKQSAIDEIFRVMKTDAIFCCFEPVISQNMHYWQILDSEEITDYFYFKEIERKIWNDKSDSLLNYDYEILESICQNGGFSNVEVSRIEVPLKITVTDKLIDGWFQSKPAPNKLSLEDRFLKYAEKKKIENYISEIKNSLRNKQLTVNSHFALIRAVK